MDPTAKIGVGIVGAGFGAAVHVPGFRSHPDCEVTAICASTSEKARATAERLKIPHFHGRWQDLVEDPSVQAVSVAVPPVVQPEIVLAALSLKKPVFCEKPLAQDPLTAKRLADAAEEAGVPTMVDFQFLEVPVWQAASRWLAEKRLGRLRHVLISWQVETHANRTGTTSWKTSSEGGTLNQFVSHTFYYIEKLASPILRLNARLHTPPGLPGSGDANVVLTAELQGGALAAVTVGSASVLGSGHRLEFYGSEGTLVIENPTRDYIRGFTARAGTRGEKQLSPLNPSSRDEDRWPEDGRIFPVSQLASRFIEAVRTGKTCRPDLRDGLRVQVMMDAARRSHRTSAWVETPTHA